MNKKAQNMMKTDTFINKITIQKRYSYKIKKLTEN